MVMMGGEDPLNRILAISVGLLIVGLIPVMLGIFFYEKILCKQKQNLKIIHRIFGIPVKQSDYKLPSPHAFKVVHCLNAPNRARLEQREGSRGFQNNGFYQLSALTDNNSSLVVDRHSHVRELNKLKELLCRY